MSAVAGSCRAATGSRWPCLPSFEDTIEYQTTPHMYVIDPKGTLIYAGAIDDKPSADAEDIASSRNHVSAALDEVLAGKPVSVASTKPYGCSVKYP